MPDFDTVKALRGPRLSDLKVHVSNVLALNLAQEDEYQVGRLTLAAFDFVPYALTGLAAAMRTPESGVRPSTLVTLPLTDDKGGVASVEQRVTLYGPGDVLGVDPGQIVRRYPPPGSTNAEETFHAHIEFDRPELPWAFSAHTPGNRMPPWLALVVFERDEVQWEPAQAGLQPILQVPAALLPPLGSQWAWAHAQAASGSASLGARLSTAYAPVNVSRLLAARVLTQNTNYVACLVPTTDAGCKAGLGLGEGTLGPAWTADGGIVRLPVYDRWEFRTAPDGDFARLARRLKGVAAPWAIGRRIMDASRPGDPLGDLGPEEPGRRQVIRCALFSPAPRPPDQPADDEGWTAERTGALKAALERPAFVEGTAGVDPGGIPNLPVIGPRIYARAQRGTGTIPAGDWFAELNLAPAHRVVAGLGTRVVVKDQEPLMQAAWAQVGEVEKANRELALAELARHLARSVHRRLEKVDPGRLLQMTRPLADRVRLDGAALTLTGQTVRSATPVTALGGAFRRALRKTGPVARRLGQPERTALSAIVAEGGVPRDFSRPYVELDGIRGLSASAIESLDARFVSVALRLPDADALSAVSRASATLEQGINLATAVTTPSIWKTPDAGFRPGAAVTDRVVGRIKQQIAETAPDDMVRSRWLGGFASAFASSGLAGTAELREPALRLEEIVAVAAGRMSAGAGSAMAGTAAGSMAGTRAGTMAGSATRGGAEVPASRGTGSMMREAAGRGSTARAGISEVAAGRSSVSIATPVGREARELREARGAADAIPTERVRLDQFRTPQATALATWLERANAVKIADIRAHVVDLVQVSGALALRPTPPRDTLAVRRNDILQRLQPSRTVIDTMRARLDLRGLAFDVFAGQAIRPIMAAPRFDRPMYQALDAYDREWLVPGLGTLPVAEMVTLLSTNDAFTEAFLVGLSDEMGRELLWRNYPTDSRGTYFHRFWDGTRDELKQAIHRFRASPLGSHVSVGPPGQSGRAVVVVRGEIVRRYPDLTVMALREQGRDPATNHPRLPEAPSGPAEAAPAMFQAMLPPDVMLVGLDIAVDELRKPGWWIVLSEHPQATRFRRVEPDLFPGEVVFASHGGGSGVTGATVAKTRLEHPTRIAFEAGDFLPSD